MKGLVCKHCGGNSFTETENGYMCDYCHALYELDNTLHRGSPPIKKKKKLKPSPISFVWLSVLSICLLSSILLSKAPSTTTLPKTPKPIAAQQSSSSKEEKYSASQLSNPERNVRIAELSLNQEEIDLAKASVAEYGGDKITEFEERVTMAQKNHDHFEKERPKKAPKKDMLVENPDSEFSMTMYYREGGFFAAYGPDFNQYTSQDILQIWGQPDEIIVDKERIRKNLAISFEGDKQLESYELKKIKEDWANGNLTWREVRALLLIAQDSSYGGYSKQFVYEKQGKPNVYFDGNQVGYVTPIVRYIAFNRLPEKHPYAGLGKYPDDFPKNYGSDGRYHEK